MQSRCFRRGWHCHCCWGWPWRHGGEKAWRDRHSGAIEANGVGVFQTSDGYPNGRRNSVLALIGFLGLCALVAVTGGLFTAMSVHGWFTTLVRPPGSPPAWVFGPVWTTLYTMMAVAAWLVWRTGRADAYPALRLWGWQLLLNALWSPAFFGLNALGLALAIILAMVAAVAWTTVRFARIGALPGMLMAPYLAWVAYATYLTAGFFNLNGR